MLSGQALPQVEVRKMEFRVYPADTGLRFFDTTVCCQIVQHNLSRADFSRFVCLPEDRRAAPFCRCTDTVAIEQPRRFLRSEHAAEIPIQRIPVIVRQRGADNLFGNIRGFDRCRSGVDNGVAEDALNTAIIIGHCFGVIPKILAGRIMVAAGTCVIRRRRQNKKNRRKCRPDKFSSA